MIRPSVVEGQYKDASKNYKIVSSYLQEQDLDFSPNQMRWKPIPSPKGKTTFVEGLVSILGAGEPSLKHGLAIYIYSANQSMQKEAFYNSDGDMLIVPSSGTLFITTLFGRLRVNPREICVIPRGIKFKIDVNSEIKGWVCELYGQHASLPELGPIGANGLALPEHFEYPTAWS